MFSQCDGELVHNEVILSANEKSFPSYKIEVSKPTRKIKWHVVTSGSTDFCLPIPLRLQLYHRTDHFIS